MNRPAGTSPKITDTERLEFLETHNVTFAGPSNGNPDFTLALFNEKGVQVFEGTSAREVIDEALRSVAARPAAPAAHLTAAAYAEFLSSLPELLGPNGLPKSPPR